MRRLSDFAGLDMLAFALRFLGVLGVHWCYEVDEAARAFLRDNHSGAVVCGSVLDRDPRCCPSFDVVVAGFPCQPFSMLGLQQGWNETRGRGSLIVAALNFVRLRSPPVAVFESVAAFCRSEEGQTMKWLVDTVVSLGHHVDHRILCTSDYGLPQTRKRWYLVALRSDIVSSTFAWPSAVASLSLAAVLGPRRSVHLPIDARDHLEVWPPETLTMRWPGSARVALMLMLPS